MDRRADHLDAPLTDLGHGVLEPPPGTLALRRVILTPMRIAPSCIVRAARLAAVALALVACGAATARAQNADVLAEVDRVMEAYRLDSHIPGMVWGIVKDGRLVHVKGAGVQDIEAKRPVTPETLFRI